MHLASPSRQEDFSLNKLPREVLLITGGVDVQGDRVEAVFIGHAVTGEQFILGHVLWGRHPRRRSGRPLTGFS